MKFARLLTRLHNTPLAIEESKLDIITSNVTLKLLAGESISALAIEPSSARDKINQTIENNSVIKVFDSLAAKNGTGDSGVTTYEDISAITQAYINAGAKTLIYYFDTPGGEVSGLFGLADYIASLPRLYGINTIGITDGMAASAGYVLASATQKLYATSSSILGSIGVVMTLINGTKADEKAGLDYTILRSKSEKALLNPHETFSEEALQEAKSKLLALDTIMNEKISSYRPQVTLEINKGLNGRTVLADEALSLGLIDGIITSVEDVINVNSDFNKSFQINRGNTQMATELETLQSKVIAQGEEIALLKARLDLIKTEAVTKEQTRVLGILEAAKTLGMSMDAAVKRIKSNSSLEDTTTFFTELKEALQAAGHIDTTEFTVTATLNDKTAKTLEQMSPGERLIAGLTALDQKQAKA